MVRSRGMLPGVNDGVLLFGLGWRPSSNRKKRLSGLRGIVFEGLSFWASSTFSFLHFVAWLSG